MKRILVVEDEKDIQTLLKVNLMLAGYFVDVANNGEEAIKKAIIHPPDLLITDLAMPVSDGTELIYQFRHSETLKNVPIIILSAFSENPEVKKVTEWAGGDTFVQKPFEFPALQSLVEKKLR